MPQAWPKKERGGEGKEGREEKEKEKEEEEKEEEEKRKKMNFKRMFLVLQSYKVMYHRSLEKPFIKKNKQVSCISQKVIQEKML